MCTAVICSTLTEDIVGFGEDCFCFVFLPDKLVKHWFSFIYRLRFSPVVVRVCFILRNRPKIFKFNYERTSKRGFTRNDYILEQNLHHFRAKVFLRIFAHMKRNEFSDIFLAQNRKYYAKSNFLSNWRSWNFKHRIKQLKIYSIHKKILTYE